MAMPLYQAVRDCPPKLEEHSHSGLWFERFFDPYDENWKVLDQGKDAWIKQVAGKCGDADALKRHALYLARRARALGGETRGFKTDWHFATGLGLPHPVENGFLWHPTLGVPYLPGAAVKGLARAWVEHWDDSPDREDHLLAWFGTEHKGAVPERAGDLIFFDALPSGPVELALDVMTPHYGKWYEQGGEIKNPAKEPEKVPADWHDPVPVPFLVVKSAALVFAIAPRRKEFKDQVEPALAALKDALEWLGAGAKTAVGYGRMKHASTIDGEIKAMVEAEHRRSEQKRREAEDQRRLATLSPLEREIEEIIEQRSDKNLAPYLALIQAVEKNRWQGEDKHRVAEKIRELMRQEKGQWKENSTKDKPEKDKEHQRTLKVLGWLKI